MKYKLIFACWAVALAVMAAPKSGYNEPTIAQDQAQVAQASIKSLPDWQALKDDRASYVADKSTYASNIMAVADAPTKTAIKNLAACVQDLQAQISDLKRVVLAVANSTTNTVIIGQ